MSSINLKKIFIYFLIFNIQLNSTFTHSSDLLQFNTVFSDEDQNEYVTSCMVTSIGGSVSVLLCWEEERLPVGGKIAKSSL